MSRRSFDDTTLWRISAYEQLLDKDADSGFAQLSRATVLPTSLNAELSHLEHRQQSSDVIEVLAACIRQRESALILLRMGGLVWPLTLFPQQNLYHLPRSMIEPLQAGGHDVAVMGVEPPGLRPPGHVLHERIAERPTYRHLPPLLWALALHAPNGRLIEEISGHAAYRITADVGAEGAPGGAMQSSLTRLRTEIASLRDIAGWPGMGPERAARLLNGAYLQGGVIVLRNHRAARPAGDTRRGILGWLRGRR